MALGRSSPSSGSRSSSRSSSTTRSSSRSSGPSTTSSTLGRGSSKTSIGSGLNIPTNLGKINIPNVGNINIPNLGGNYQQPYNNRRTPRIPNLGNLGIPNIPRPRTNTYRRRDDVEYANNTPRRNREFSYGPFIIAVVIVFIIVATVAVMLYFHGKNSSTTERTPLALSASQPNKLYWDNINSLEGSGAVLEKGLKVFQERTGVRPCLVIDDNLRGNYVTADTTDATVDLWMDQLYAALKLDQYHLLVVFYYNEADDEMYLLMRGGTATKAVIDDEAYRLLDSLIWQNYENTSLSVGQMFGNAFDTTSKRIMKTYKSPWPAFWGGVVLIAVIFGAYFILRISFARKKEKEAHIREVLNTPIIDMSGDASFGEKKET